MNAKFGSIFVLWVFPEGFLSWGSWENSRGLIMPGISFPPVTIHSCKRWPLKISKLLSTMDPVCRQKVKFNCTFYFHI